MSGRVTKWSAERLEQGRTLAEAHGVREAARLLGVTPSALRSAFNANGLDYSAPLPPAEIAAPPPPPASPQRAAEAPGEAPAWVGYRPRLGWREPWRVQEAKAAAPTVSRVAILADVHCPYHDRKAWACALGVLRDWQPSRVVLLGDFMDMESLSRHPKSRPDLVRLAEEYHAANVALDEVQSAAPDATWLALEGNHEVRCARFCAEFGTLDGMLSVPQALYMEANPDSYHRATAELRGVTWVPLRRQPFVIEGVGYLHGVFENLHHAASHAEKLGPSVGVRHLIAGHTHDFQSFTSAAGYSCHHAGWLGDGAAAVFAYTKGRPRPWASGMLLQEIAGDLVTTIPIPFASGRALIGGHVLAAA